MGAQANVWKVRDGVTREEIDNGIREWRAKHGHEVSKAGKSSQYLEREE
jgi:hypothetical protein